MSRTATRRSRGASTSSGRSASGSGGNAAQAREAAEVRANLAEARARHAHIGDAMLHHDIVAVYLLRQRTAVTKAGRFVGRVRADCNSILKTHKHLFKVKPS